MGVAARDEVERVSRTLRARLPGDGHRPARAAAATVHLHGRADHEPGGEVGPLPNHPRHIDQPVDSGEPRETEPRKNGVDGRLDEIPGLLGGLEGAPNEPRLCLNNQLTTLLQAPSTHPNTMYLLRQAARPSLRARSYIQFCLRQKCTKVCHRMCALP